MTTETQTPEATAPEDNRLVPVAMADDIALAFGAMLELIPETAGDGMENVLRQIAAASTPTALDSPWRSEGLTPYLGVPLQINGARRLESDYADGLGWFLVLDCVTSAGELVTVTTGATSVVAQVAKAYQMGAIPLRVIPRESKRATAAGFHPQHLEVIG